LVKKPFYVVGLGLALAQICPAVQLLKGVPLDQAPAPSPGAQSLPSGDANIPGATKRTKPQATASPTQTATAEDDLLQAQIQSALGNEPTLSRDSVRVSVVSGSIELAGSVGTSRERLTATRLAMSYAGSRRVITRITVAGAGASSDPTPVKKNTTGTQTAASPVKVK
jgi:osmotically-inducible protein OsmY